MSCTHDQHFVVKVSISVTKEQRGYASGREEITYGQNFEIAATDFTGVAKILGNFDKAIGDIHKCKELPL